MSKKVLSKVKKVGGILGKYFAKLVDRKNESAAAKGNYRMSPKKAARFDKIEERRFRRASKALCKMQSEDFDNL